MRDMRLGAIAALVVLAAGLLGVGCGPEYPNCDNDEDCHEGEFCVNGQCQMCRTDSDCPAGQSCQSGACEPIPGYCSSTADCPDGQECENNRCVRPATASTDLGETGGDSGPSCSLQPVYFGFDEDNLTASARSSIQSNVECMQTLGASGLHVTGHADPRGTEEYNLALGDRRATSVREYMLSLGLDSSSVSSSSMGEEMATGTDDPGWRNDRRVDFTRR